MPERVEVFLASNNRHKLAEMARLFFGWTVRLPREAGLEFRFEEAGTSFLENAWGKARALYRQVRRPVLADDSGLCVEALGGEPGIRSARYGAERPGESLSDTRRTAYLLKQMKGVADRRCFFVCCMVLILAEHRFFIAQETVHGELAQAPRGFGGFGYDPVFFLTEAGRTMAELSDGEKDRVSHRGRAARSLLRIAQT